MPNMSYCRFTNTLQDLVDCEGSLCDDGLPENAEEKRNAIRLIKLCQRIASDYEDLLPEPTP